MRDLLAEARSCVETLVRVPEASEISEDFLVEGTWGSTRRPLMKILDKGPLPSKGEVEKLAKRLGDGVSVHNAGKYGFELRTRLEGKGEQILYSVGPNSVVWYFWQGRREQPVGFMKDLMKAPVKKVDGYPEFQGNLPKEDPWVMAGRINPKHPAIPADVRKYVGESQELREARAAYSEVQGLTDEEGWRDAVLEEVEAAVVEAAEDSFNRFIEYAMKRAKLTKAQAKTAYERLKKEKLIKIDPVSGGFPKVKHGRVLDPDVLRRAAGLEEGLSEGKRPGDYSRGGGGRASELSWSKGPKPPKDYKVAAKRGERHSKKKHIDAQMRGEGLSNALGDALMEKAVELPVEVSAHQSQPGDFRMGFGNSPASGGFAIRVYNGYGIRSVLKKHKFRFDSATKSWVLSRIRPAEGLYGPTPKQARALAKQPSEKDMEQALAAVDNAAREYNSELEKRQRKGLASRGYKEKPEADLRDDPKGFVRGHDQDKRAQDRWKRYGIEMKFEGRGPGMRVVFTGKGTYPLREIFKKAGFRYGRNGWSIPISAWDAVKDKLQTDAFKLLPKAKGAKTPAQDTKPGIGTRLKGYKRSKEDPEWWMYMREKHPWLEAIEEPEELDVVLEWLEENGDELEEGATIWLSDWARVFGERLERELNKRGSLTLFKVEQRGNAGASVSGQFDGADFEVELSATSRYPRGGSPKIITSMKVNGKRVGGGSAKKAADAIAGAASAAA